jgi:hypothetical protein
MVKLEKFHLDNIILMDLEVEILKTIDYNLWLLSESNNIFVLFFIII